MKFWLMEMTKNIKNSIERTLHAGVLLKSNIGERVVLDRERPHDILKEIESLYSAVVKPVINEFSGKDTYSVLIENNKLTYPVFLGK